MPFYTIIFKHNHNCAFCAAITSQTNASYSQNSETLSENSNETEPMTSPLRDKKRLSQLQQIRANAQIKARSLSTGTKKHS